MLQITAQKMMTKHVELVTLLSNIEKDVPASNNVRITKPADLRLYIYSNQDIVLMIPAADGFANND